MFELQSFYLNTPYQAAGLDEQPAVRLDAFLCGVSPEIGTRNRPAVIICPGGGYEFLSDREADPIALRFCSFGINAFVLRYSICDKPFPTALLEAAAAVAFVRSNAAKWDINTQNISVCGFSAGGHLAACLGVHWNKDFVRKAMGGGEEHRPNALILGYPVITSGKFAHEGSIRNIIGTEPEAERLELVSLEKQVSIDTPRTFIWHCFDDNCVPVENTIDFIRELSKNKISCECHIYPFGGHGISLADDCTASFAEQVNASCEKWFGDAVRFIKN